MRTIHYCKVLLTACTMMALTACASNPSTSVKRADKDSGIFNGDWVAHVKKSAATQTAGAWQLSCNIGTPTLPIQVDAGEISFYFNKQVQTTYVNSKGQFRFAIPLTERSSESARSDIKLDQGKTTLVLVGSLKTLKGRVTFAVQEFGGAGCTATIRYAKKGNAV